MAYILAVVVAVLGLGVLFVVPWLGAAMLFAALVVGSIAVFGAVGSGRRRREDVPNTALPGPGDPRSGVDS